ncbi:carbohydrate kinase family protein [Streptomyces sp. NPDC006552]|uniref:carbohydrate kinase family protein n=1 Tax=Streptomyces sp. NPDC006552 TaxID=3157179 RepID=UPI0033BAEBBE
MTAPRVLVVGATNFDIIIRSERLPGAHEKLRGGDYCAAPGGSAANTAIGLARAGCAVRLVSAVGNDLPGRLCLDELRAGGVDVSLVHTDGAHRTGMAVVFSDSGGKRMMTFAGADRERALASVTVDDMATADHVHLVGEPSASLARLTDLADRAGCTVSVEWNGRDMTPLGPVPALHFMNADEAARLPGAVAGDPQATARQLAVSVGRHVVLTLGARGALWATPEGALFHEGTRELRPVDRTGGGDAFDAGVIAAWLHGASPVTCLRQGLDAASHVIMKIGAHP